MDSKTKPKVNRRIIIGATVGIASLLIATPSYAISIDVNSIFTQIVQGVNGYFEQVKADTLASVDKKWGGLKDGAKKATNESTGDMNMPNPISAGDRIKTAIIKNKGSYKDTNIVEGAIVAGNELERNTTRASIESILGEVGQQRTKKEIETTQQTVLDTQTLANDAQSMDASQNILKVIAAQNAQVVSMLGQSRTDGLLSRHDAQQTNLMLSQIAEQGASERQRENLQIDGLAAQYLEVSGFSSLRTTTIEK
ncbi:MAG: hypothetical protein HC815_05930 [Richelia sp. RM1_1_1]|nr:hypothetical protein [Richelia sp. RM1_1_1]